MVRTMKNLLLPFPVVLLGVALLWALMATYYFYQKKLSTWLFIGSIVVSLGVGAIGSYYLTISIKPDLSTEEVKYCREINDHLSFSTKYVFENKNNQELTVSFPSSQIRTKYYQIHLCQTNNIICPMRLAPK